MKYAFYATAITSAFLATAIPGVSHAQAAEGLDEPLDALLSEVKKLREGAHRQEFFDAERRCTYIEDYIKTHDTSGRRMVIVSKMSAVLSSITEKRQKDFNSSIVPSTQIGVGSGPAVSLPSGIAPESISDPEMRRQLEEAKKHLVDDMRSYAFQADLAALNEMVENALANEIRHNFSLSEQEEATSILREQGIPSDEIDEIERRM